MRPNEIDYSSKARHFFDTSNGEVLVGRQQKVAYLREGADAGSVVELGPLLRAAEEESRTWDHDRLSTQNWDNERILQYGQWLNRIVSPPQENQKRLTRDIIINAGRLGLGPGLGVIRNRFGHVSRFFVEIGAKDTHRMGIFDEWTLDDFANYLREVGGESRPKRSQINALAARNPRLPKARLIEERFSEHGRFNGALTLAGYWVTDSWSEEDYVEWGLKFMDANSGILPVQSAANYLSKKQQGPSGRTIHTNFGSLTAFQEILRNRYAEHHAMRLQERAKMFKEIEADHDKRRVPLELFQFEGSEELSFDELRKKHGDNLLVRYGKYRVLEYLLPNMGEERKTEIALGGNGKDFIVLVRQSNPIPAGEIEHAALVLGYFDEIWPSPDVEKLKLDEQYEDFVKERTAKSKQMAVRRQKAAAEVAYTVK
jgi:hypothetical protein